MSQAIRHVSKKTSRTAYQHGLGRRVAELLSGAWRDSDLTPPTLSEAELAEIVPLLCESGSGALGWWRIRNTPLADTESGQQLHDVYRRHRLSALIHERELAEMLSLLRAEGIEPVLIKGWAIARLYPDAGLRPYGDIDLCIRPDQFAQASAALKCLAELDGHYVDLHSGFARIGQTRRAVGRRRRQEAGKEKLARRVWDELYSRSLLVPLDQGGAVARPRGPRPGSPDGVGRSGRASQDQSKVQSPKSKVLSEPPASAGGPTILVRIPGLEDHLRILSAHLLRSGARRPPWLCDIALLLEQVQSPKSKVQSPFAEKSDFNWDLCLGDGSNRVLNWLATTIGLAQQLLRADIGEIENTRLAGQLENSPRWLAPSVLRQWGRSRVQSPRSKVPSHVTVRGLQTPDSRLRTNLFGLWTRFDNPVRATAAVGGQFNNWPRLPYRVAELVMRLPEVPEQLASLPQQFAARPDEPLAPRSGSLSLGLAFQGRDECQPQTTE